MAYFTFEMDCSGEGLMIYCNLLFEVIKVIDNICV